jgi:hypothetical protein
MTLVRRIVAAALHRRPQPCCDSACLEGPDEGDTRPAVGWHESSYELRCGLEVVELEFAAA